MNTIIYIKNKETKDRYQAISSLKNLTYAPTLMYAALIPIDKKDRIKEWAEHVKKCFPYLSIQLRVATKNKVLFEL